MSHADTLQALRDSGLTAVAKDGRIIVSPKDKITDAVKALILADRDGLHDYLERLQRAEAACEALAAHFPPPGWEGDAEPMFVLTWEGGEAVAMGAADLADLMAMKARSDERKGVRAADDVAKILKAARQAKSAQCPSSFILGMAVAGGLFPTTGGGDGRESPEEDTAGG